MILFSNTINDCLQTLIFVFKKHLETSLGGNNLFLGLQLYHVLTQNQSPQKIISLSIVKLCFSEWLNFIAILDDNARKCFRKLCAFGRWLWSFRFVPTANCYHRGHSSISFLAGLQFSITDVRRFLFLYLDDLCKSSMRSITHVENQLYFIWWRILFVNNKN